MSMNFNWNFAQPTNGQAAFDASQAALQNKRNNAYTQNMGDRQVGNANDMMSWMQQGNDAAAYQQEQALAAEQQAQQEAAQKQAQIDSIKARISELESQIAANQAKLNNWQGVGSQIAALEARKINSQDPTSIWRWKVDRDEARRIANMEKDKTKQLTAANAMYEIQNDLDSIIVDDKMDSATQKAYLGKLAGLKTLAQKNGISTSAIDAKIKEVKGDTETSKAKSPEGTEYEGTSREQWDNEAEELLGKPNLTQGDIMKFKHKNPNISNEVRQKLEAKHSALIERDKKKTYEKKWNSWLADYEKKNGAVSDRIKQHLRKRFDKENKKG